jgi:hypothetical protein
MTLCQKLHRDTKTMWLSYAEWFMTSIKWWSAIPNQNPKLSKICFCPINHEKKLKLKTFHGWSILTIHYSFISGPLYIYIIYLFIYLFFHMTNMHVFYPLTNFFSLNGMQHLDPSVKKLAILKIAQNFKV